MDTQMVIVWAVIAAVFAIGELVSMAFVAMYISLGAVAAAITAAFTDDLKWQLLAFIGAGVGLLALTRPFIKHALETPDVPTNIDRMLGSTGVVTVKIDNHANTGQVRINSQYWNARMPQEHHDVTIPVDAGVKVVSLDGATVLVEANAAPSGGA